MLSTLSALLSLLGALSLLIAPGLMVIGLLPGGISPSRSRLPAAFALSPGIVALELGAAALAGVPFWLFAPLAALGNLAGAAAVLLKGRVEISFRIPPAWLVTSLVIIVPLALIVTAMPLRRAYGFHNMMQLAAMEAIYTLPRLPEDLSLAGTTLNYGWLGWAQIAAMAELTAIAPTLLFLPINLIHLLCLCVLMCEAANLLLPVTKPHGMAAVGIATALALLSPGLIEVLRGLVQPGFWPLGDLRTTPILGKYGNMDMMVPGLSALSLATLLLIRAAQSRNLAAARMMVIALLTASLVYPLFYPSCIAIAGSFLAVAFVAGWLPQWHFASYSRRDLATLLAWCVAAFALVAIYLRFLSQDAVTAPVALRALSLIPWQTKKLAWIFALTDALLVLAAYRAWRARSGVTMLLVLLASGLQMGYLLFSMPLAVEYKFLFAALMVSTPAIAAILAPPASASTPQLASAVTLFIAVLAACLAVVPRWHQPILTMAEPLAETSHEVHPEQSWSNTWMRAVREQTPADAVLLTGPTSIPVAVFTGRPLYVCADARPAGGTPQTTAPRPGYSMTCQQELQEVKGYSPAEVSRRQSVLQIALGEQVSTGEADKVLEELKRLRRPVALHLPSGAGLREWLQSHGIGKAVFTSDAEVVWVIERSDFPPPSASAGAKS